MFVMKLLTINMRVTDEHGPAIWEVESGSPSRAYVLISEDVAFPINAITGKSAQRVEI